MVSLASAMVTMPATYHSYRVVLRQTFQAGMATTAKAETKSAARRSWPHMRSPWKTVCPPRSVLEPTLLIAAVPHHASYLHSSNRPGRARDRGRNTGEAH